MRRLLALLAVVAGGAAFAGAAQAKTVGPLTIETRLEPRYIFFAGTITAQLDVLYDPRVVDPSTVETAPAFGTWQEIGTPTKVTSSSATLERDTWRFQISCLTYGCVPKQPSVQSFKLPPFTITARSRSGTVTNATASWPSAQVTARYYPPEVGNVRPALRPQTTIPVATYSIAPGTLAALLDAAGVVLIVVAVGTTVLLLYRRRVAARRAAAERSELERAVRLVREARERAPEDRRRAASNLAQALGSTGPERTASEVAWSRHEPSPERLDDLVDAVEDGR